MNPRKLSWIQHLNNYFTIEEINMYPLDESDSTEVVLLQDPGSGIWIGDWTLASLKMIMGEAREKFASIAGPGGGTSLNGSALKSEGLAQQTQLLEDLKRYVDYSQPITWIIG